jgi:FMN reductase
MSRNPLIVGLGGTTRTGSTSERALLLALSHASELGCDTLAFGGAQMPSEPYDPSRPERSDAARALVEALRRADGVLISSPAYHGGVSGLVKNAIDYTEDLRGDQRAYLQGRAVGCIVCAEGAQAMGSTLASLRAWALYNEDAKLTKSLADVKLPSPVRKHGATPRQPRR